jgi:hypothetical protein
MHVRRRAAIALGAAILAASGIGATAFAQRGDDNPETVCHKPGTAAEQQLTFDNDALFQAHLKHGDTQGPCTVAAQAPPPAVVGADAAAPVTAQARTAG